MDMDTGKERGEGREGGRRERRHFKVHMAKYWQLLTYAGLAAATCCDKPVCPTTGIHFPQSWKTTPKVNISCPGSGRRCSWLAGDFLLI